MAENLNLAAVESACPAQSKLTLLSSVALRSLQDCEMHSASCGLSDNPHIYSPPFSLAGSVSVCPLDYSDLVWSVRTFCAGDNDLPSISLGGRLDQDRLTSDGPTASKYDLK